MRNLIPCGEVAVFAMLPLVSMLNKMRTRGVSALPCVMLFDCGSASHKNGTQSLFGRRFYKVIDLSMLSLSLYLLVISYNIISPHLLKVFFDFK